MSLLSWDKTNLACLGMRMLYNYLCFSFPGLLFLILWQWLLWTLWFLCVSCFTATTVWQSLSGDTKQATAWTALTWIGLIKWMSPRWNWATVSIFRLCLLMPHASVFIKCMFKQRRIVLVKIRFFYKYPIYVVQYYNITVDTLSEFGRLTIFFTMVIALVQTTVFLKIGK